RFRRAVRRHRYPTCQEKSGTAVRGSDQLRTLGRETPGVRPTASLRVTLLCHSYVHIAECPVFRQTLVKSLRFDRFTQPRLDCLVELELVVQVLTKIPVAWNLWR